MHKLLFYSFLISIVICKLKYEENKDGSIEQLQKIILNNKFRKLILITSNDTHGTLFQRLAHLTNSHNFPTITISIEEVKLFNGKYHEKFSYEAIQQESNINIILAGNMNYFTTILQETVKLYYWRSRERVIVHFENGTKEEMEQIFKLCWKKDIINIIIIFANIIYTYNPYFDKYNILLNNTNVFYEKYMDLNGYKIKFSRFLTPLDMIIINGKTVGRDGISSKTLSSALNATYEYFPPRDGITYGLKFANGSMTGVFNDVATTYTDMAINSRLVKLQFENILEHTYPHDREDIACLVPKSSNQPEYKKFTTLLPKQMWLLLGVSMFMYMIIWHFSMELKKREFFQVVFNILAMTLGYPIADQYGLKLRAILISYRFYIFLMLASYSAGLTSVLTVPIQHPEINTLSELERSGLKIIAATRFKDMLTENTGSSLTATLVNSITTVPDDPDIERVVKERGHNAIILKETFAIKAVLEKDNFKNGMEIYRIMKERPMPSQVCYALRYGSPALPRINYLLRRFQESGLNEYWKHATIHLLAISKSMEEMEEEGADHSKLRVVTLDNVSAAYYILGIGISASFIVFIGENVYNGIKKKIVEKKRNKIKKSVVKNQIKAIETSIAPTSFRNSCQIK